MYIDVKLNKGEILINEGAASDCLYILKSGELAIFKYDPIEKRHNVIGHVQAGEMVGEMSFLDNMPRSASVRANTDCEVALLNRAEFEKILTGQDKMIQHLVKTLSERLRKTNNKVRL